MNLVLSGFIDRIVQDKIVLIIEDTNKEYLLNRESYPHIKSGDWVKVSFEGNNILEIVFDEVKAHNTQKEIEATLRRLQRKQGSKFVR